MTNQTPDPAEVTAAQPLETAGGAPLGPSTPQVPAAVVPTQVRKPWRATARTTFAAVLALAAMLPLLVEASGLEETAGPVAGALAIAAAITRIMAIPNVEDFLQHFLPFLSAAGRPDVLDERADRGERGAGELSLALGVVLLLALVLFLTGHLPLVWLIVLMVVVAAVAFLTSGRIRR